MKNIHILPTNQKSKIFFNHNKGFEKYQFSKEPFVNGLTNTSNQNIYITNDEEIKDGDWVLLPNKEVVRIPSNIKSIPINNFIRGYALSYCKKIILTTDQDLIKFTAENDGVQAIDDEFLEWFVKNPSCESIEVAFVNYKKGAGLIISSYKTSEDYKYKIIIPKEEPTIVRLPTYYESKQEIKLEDIFNDDKKENIKKFIDEIQDPSEPNQALKDAAQRYMEQKTLQEVALEFAKDHYEMYETSNYVSMYFGFYWGVKWQQERSYSEEEVEDLIYKVCGTVARLQGITLNGNHIDTAYKQHKKK